MRFHAIQAEIAIFNNHLTIHVVMLPNKAISIDNLMQNITEMSLSWAGVKADIIRDAHDNSVFYF